MWEPTFCLYKGALALFLDNEAHGHQPLDSVPDGGPGYIHGLGQLPFGHQFFTGFEFPPVNQFPDLVKDLIGNPFGLYGLDRYGHLFTVSFISILSHAVLTIQSVRSSDFNKISIKSGVISAGDISR